MQPYRRNNTGKFRGSSLAGEVPTLAPPFPVGDRALNARVGSTLPKKPHKTQDQTNASGPLPARMARIPAAFWGALVLCSPCHPKLFHKVFFFRDARAGLCPRARTCPCAMPAPVRLERGEPGAGGCLKANCKAQGKKKSEASRRRQQQQQHNCITVIVSALSASQASKNRPENELC